MSSNNDKSSKPATNLRPMPLPPVTLQSLMQANQMMAAQRREDAVQLEIHKRAVENLTAKLADAEMTIARLQLLQEGKLAFAGKLGEPQAGPPAPENPQP